MDRLRSRRQFMQGVGVAGLGLLAGCGRLPSHAQSPPKLRRIGWLSPYSPGSSEESIRFEWFRQGLHEHDWMEGRNLIIEARSAPERDEQLPALAAELVRLPVDVLVTVGGYATRAAMEATATIPIVFATGTNPVAAGLAASYAQPRGNANVTGITSLVAALSAKRLELLKEAAPGTSRVAVFHGGLEAFREAQRAAQVLAVDLQSFAVRGPGDLESGLEAARQWGADALVFEAQPLFSVAGQRLANFTAEHRLPAMSGYMGFASAGGLMNYGPRSRDNFVRAAAYVDRILRGAQPADLPVEQPTQLDFVINLKTAQALGLTIPPHVLLQATEVLQ